MCVIFFLRRQGTFFFRNPINFVTDDVNELMNKLPISTNLSGLEILIPNGHDIILTKFLFVLKFS